MSTYTQNVSVVEIIGNWKYSENLQGQFLTRTFVDYFTKPSAAASIIKLPVFGDSFYMSDSSSNLKVASIDVNYINNTDNCGKMYVVNYSLLPDTVVATPVERFIVNADTGCQYQTFTQDTSSTQDTTLSAWRFPSGRSVQNYGIPRREINTSFKVQRYYYDRNTLQSWTDLSTRCAGKLNPAGVSTYKWASGSAIYLGSTAQQTSRGGAKCWIVTLNFAIKQLPDITTDTWQYIYDLHTNTYEKIYG